MRRAARIGGWAGIVLTLSMTALGDSGGAVPRIPLHKPRPRTPGGTNAPQGGSLTGVYHNGGTLVCSDCHVMHASEQHGFQGETAVAPFPIPNAGPPNRKLLRKATPTELCLACHDGIPGIPDVLGADINGLTERAAGAFELLDTPSFRGHNLARNPGADLCLRCHFGGTMATASVACIDCHAYHGNQNYRNLQWASWPGGEPEIRALSPSGLTGVAKYEKDNVRYPAPASGDTSYLEVTTICSDCHHVFMDQGTYTRPSPTSHWIRHPGTYTEAGSHRPVDFGPATNPDFWVNGTFATPRLPFVVAGATTFTAAGTVDAKNEVFCLTCHKAHGSGEPFALRWHYSGLPQPVTSDGCQQCHKDR